MATATGDGANGFENIDRDALEAFKRLSERPRHSDPVKSDRRQRLGEKLQQLVRELLGTEEVDLDPVEYIRGRYLQRVGRLTFTLRMPEVSGYDPELELMTFHCRECSLPAYPVAIVHTFEDVGQRIASHMAVHDAMRDREQQFAAGVSGDGVE